MLLARLGGAPYPSMPIATKKAWTPARAQACPGWWTGIHASGAGFDMDDFGDARYSGFGSGLPCKVGCEAIGADALSGLATDEDIRLTELGFAAPDMTTK